MNAVLHRVAHLIFKDYRINWIYAADAGYRTPHVHGDTPHPVDGELQRLLALSTTPKMANSLTYTRAGLEGFAIVREGLPLCVAHFARKEQYGRSATWPLGSNEVALMDIVTEGAARGQGLAPKLIAATTRHYLDAGFDRLIAFIWWRNSPSLRAFTAAGWYRAGLSIELQFARRWRCYRIRLRRHNCTR